MFGYSSVSELQSFPPLAARLQGFRHRVYRERKVIKFCLFEFRLNGKQHVMPHQGLINNFTSVDTVQFYSCKNPVNFLFSMNESARRCVFSVQSVNMTNCTSAALSCENVHRTHVSLGFKYV